MSPSEEIANAVHGVVRKVALEYFGSDTGLFRELPQNVPFSSFAFKMIVEHGYLERRLRFLARQLRSAQPLEPHLIYVLSLRGKQPRDFFLATDDSVRERWLEEARDRCDASTPLERPDNDVAVPGSLQLPTFLRCTPAEWAALMQALKLEYLPGKGRYRWPKLYSWRLARWLLNLLVEAGDPPVIDTSGKSFGDLFVALFWRDGPHPDDPRRASKQLSREGFTESRRINPGDPYLEKIVAQVFGV